MALFPPAAPPNAATPAEIRRVRPRATPAAPPTALPRRRPPKVDSESKLEHLTEFNKKYLGASDYDVTAAALGEIFYSNLTTCNDALLDTPLWTRGLPTRLDLFRTKFGRQDLNHSFGQEACFETTLLHTLCSGYLAPPDTVAVCATHPLIGHLAATKVAYASYDFRWLREYNIDWDNQKVIDPAKQEAMTACLFHYNLDTSMLMRYLGNNYTGAYRQVDEIVKKLRALKITESLTEKYVRVMLTGCPNHFVAETTRANALLHWRMRNGPTVAKKLDQVDKTMNKEDKNNFVIPLPHWTARYIPNLFFTPQHILEKPGKKDRQISDASKRYNPESTPINMMTSTPRGSEEQCTFGRVREEVYSRLYNLRITYPDRDLIIHANDVKSAFRQIKLHPDIMGAFSFIIADRLFLSCGLPFGADFSPANWEIIRQLLEELAVKLFDDASLVAKHKQYLDQLQFDRSLGKTRRVAFARAIPDGFNSGVLDSAGTPASTPHKYYVDDGIYAELYDIARIKRAVAASIEAVFLLLGDSELDRRQDPVSFDKLLEMFVAPANRILGHIIDTRRMTVSIPDEFTKEVSHLLRTTWGPHRFRFFINEAEELAGKLGHVAYAAPWLRYLMSHIYCSLAMALGIARADLIRSNRAFRKALQLIKNAPDGAAGNRTRTFHQAETARQVHKYKKPFNISKLLRAELAIISRVLADPSIRLECPIAHLISREPFAHGFSDSSLRAAGGYCASLNVWWYMEWSDDIRQRTLLHLKNNNSGKFIDINVLEYAGLLITFVACYHRLVERRALEQDPNPMVLVSGDNTVSESWSRKASKHSPIGRALGRIQCGLMIDNPVGFLTDHIPTEENVVADKISRIESELALSHAFPRLCQEHPALSGCQRFLPSSDLVSCIMAALLRSECREPVSLSRLVLQCPGRITSSPGATA